MKKTINKKKVLMLLLLAVVCTVFPSSKVKAATVGDYIYSYNSSSKTATIKEYTGDDVNVEIPKTLGGYKVTRIARYAFSKKVLMQTVKIPNTIRTINEGAFSECKSLIDITIPNSVTTLEGKAFYKCPKLETVELGKGIRTICYKTFEGCESLININLPDSINKIGRYAFSKCINLNNVIIPISVSDIGEFAFSYCTSLMNITLNEGLYCINRGIIEGCSSLEEITIPSTVVEYNGYIFRENRKLKRIILKTNMLIPNNQRANIFYKNQTFNRIEVQCYKNNKIIDSINRKIVKYMDTIPSTDITLSKDNVIISKGSAEELTSTLEPTNSTDTIIFSSSDKKIVSVDQRGYIYGVTPGKASIFVRTNSGCIKKVNIVVNPEQVKGFALKSRGTNHMKVKWKSSNDVDGYDLYIKSSEGYKHVIDLSGASPEYTFSKLKSGTKYQFAIKAYKVIDDSKVYSDDYSVLNTFTRLDKVSGFVKKSVGKTDVSTVWKKTTGATGYRMYIYQDKKWKKVATVKTNNYVFKNLKRHKKYKFAVVAIKTVDKTTVASIDYPSITVTTK